MKYDTLIDVSLGYYNLNLDQKASHLTTFSCPFEVLLHKTTIWSGPGRRHVPEEHG